MRYVARYESPIGPVTLASDGERLVGLWFDGQRYDRAALADEELANLDLPIFAETRRWLDLYFSGAAPDFTPPLKLEGTTLRREVGALMLAIPYGQTTTYGALAQRVAERRGRGRSSARAVGGAVAHNPISLVVPCHRVIGAKGKLTGYAGGLEKKIWLLQHEGVALDQLSR
ncbi:MAG: methylated-DNA--[protein]-cysteine S-methyltransferase [Thermoguttaceae bacterium]|jgi:O-6-methylguanine DNA methyltransferase